ncbi:MAG: hypothetical protein ACKO9Q_21275, partial [Pirellula sp.]
MDVVGKTSRLAEGTEVLGSVGFGAAGRLNPGTTGNCVVPDVVTMSADERSLLRGESMLTGERISKFEISGDPDTLAFAL